MVYLDDFLLIAHTYNLCLKNISATLNLLSSLGFIINMPKSVLTPSRACRFLGVIFNTETFAVAIPPDRKKILLQMTLEILNKKRCKIRYLASYIGSLISVCPAVQYGLLNTKILEREKFLALMGFQTTSSRRECLSKLRSGKIFYGGSACLQITRSATISSQVSSPLRSIQTLLLQDGAQYVARCIHTDFGRQRIKFSTLTI